MSKQSSTIKDPLASPTREFLCNPYPTFAQMREEAPVLWSEKGKYWLISRYQDASDILRDLHYEKGFGRNKPINPLLHMIPVVSEQLKYHGKAMLNQNPPEHTRLRSLVNKAFTPAMVSQMRPHIEDIANQLLDKVQAAGEMDLIADFAFVVPVTVIAEMLGVPSGDHERFKIWSHALTGIIDPNPKVSGALSAVKANTELIAYLRPLVEDRRKNPKNDLISALTAAEVDGSKLTEYELMANVILILVAGHETTVNLIGNSVLALLRNPEQLALLKSNPDLMESAVEEFLRYDGPAQLVRRNAGSDMELAGQKIRENDVLFVLTGSANRDPAQFENPEQLDIRRENNKHLAFGTGIHHCLGAALARAEAQIALSTLLKRMPDLKLKTTELEYRTPFNLRGVKSMPVAF